MDPSDAKIQSSWRHSPCFFLFLTFYVFVKLQNLLNNYVNKEMKQYLELEELCYITNHIIYYKELQMIFYFQLLSLIQSDYS